MRARFEVMAVSPLYDVPAVGDASQPAFVNLAVRLRTDLPPAALRAACRHLEERCGRRRTADRFAPRTLDLDPVYGTDLPAHRDLRAQSYVLVPCADVWPDAHPVGWPRTLGEEAQARFPDWRAAHRRVEDRGDGS
jgi:2-amino-4-hydroxy-6-hydroxymethyldihydropteridine diphosphokinase